MIKINSIKINPRNFPDGTLLINDFPICEINNTRGNYYSIIWKYESDSELFLLICCVKHLRDVLGNGIKIDLFMRYLPNARMDRTKSDSEIFTLKYFCDIINSLNFNKVYVFDVHSNVSKALLNSCIDLPAFPTIYSIIRRLKPDYIYFPDEGAMKRYSVIIDKSNNSSYDNITIDKIIYGKKNRDWDTGKILGLTINDKNGNIIENEEVYTNDIGDTDIIKPLQGVKILMIDDIVSYGGTLAYSADKLKELGASEIYAYASHTENSVLDEEKSTLLKRLENGTVEKLYTTDSLYSGNHDKIEVII